MQCATEAKQNAKCSSIYPPPLTQLTDTPRTHGHTVPAHTRAHARTHSRFYDFKSGADKKETADDRALVDGNVTAASVWSSALGFLGAGSVQPRHARWQCYRHRPTRLHLLGEARRTCTDYWMCVVLLYRVHYSLVTMLLTRRHMFNAPW